MLSKIRSIGRHFKQKAQEIEAKPVEQTVQPEKKKDEKAPRPEYNLPPPSLGGGMVVPTQAPPVKEVETDRVEGKSFKELWAISEQKESLATRAFRRAKERGMER